MLQFLKIDGVRIQAYLPVLCAPLEHTAALQVNMRSFDEYGLGELRNFRPEMNPMTQT